MGSLVKVAKKKDIAQGGGISTEVQGKRIAVFHVNGQYYAIDDECTHAGGSLAEGSVDGNEVTCPLHGATFDITNGQATGEPAEEGVTSYKVVVEGEDIKIEV